MYTFTQSKAVSTQVSYWLHNILSINQIISKLYLSLIKMRSAALSFKLNDHKTVCRFIKLPKWVFVWPERVL